MTIKAIRKRGLEIYHKNENPFWILGLSCGLLIAGTYSISLAVPILLLIIVPFLIIPIFFAGHCAFLAIQGNERITFNKAVGYFLTYFRNPYSSSFSFMKAFFKCLLVFLVVFIISAPIGYSIANAVDPAGMNGLINELNELMRQTTYTTEQLYAIINKYFNVVTIVTYVTLMPTVFITLIFFTFFISKNSVSVYYRLSCPVVDSSLLNAIHHYLESKNRRLFWKTYFGLNWPLYIILLVGYGAGMGLCLALQRDAFFASILSVSFAFIAVAFYLPFYFPNMQAMYEAISPLYQEATIETTNKILRNIRQSEELKQDNETKSEIVDIDINKEDNNERND